MWIGHRKEVRKLTFRALALRRSEHFSSTERAVSKLISLQVNAFIPELSSQNKGQTQAI